MQQWSNLESLLTVLAAAGILLLYASGNPNGNFFGGFAANCGLAYYTTEISLNFITTVLIIGRLLWISRYMGRNLGPATSETYVNAIAIVVESALPYTICGIVYLVTYGVQSDISVLFLAIYGMMTVRTCIAYEHRSPSRCL